MNDKSLPKLTRKQKIFVKEIVNNPKQSATAAAIKAYDETTYGAAAAIASENLKKPQIMLYLQNAAEKAEMALINVLDYSERYGAEGGKGGAAYAAVATKAAGDVLDRVHGKATQRVEVASKTISITIDLTKAAPQTEE